MLDIYDADISFQFDNLKIKVIRIRYGVFPRSFPRHRHGNRFYEAHLVCGGKGTLIVDSAKYDLSAGSLYMTGPLVTHEQLIDSTDPMDEYCFQFEVTENRKAKSGRSAELIKNTYFWIGTDTQNMHHLFEMLTEENEKQEVGYVKNVVSIVSLILVSLVRNYTGSEKAGAYAKTTPGDKRMLIVDDGILYDYATITLKEISRRLGLSPRQTQRFVKKTYGKTFIEMRTEARMNKARALIAMGMSPQEAATAVGYESAQSLKLPE